MNYPAAELRGIKMNFYLINPDAEHRGILLIKLVIPPENSVTDRFDRPSKRHKKESYLMGDARAEIA